MHLFSCSVKAEMPVGIWIRQRFLIYNVAPLSLGVLANFISVTLFKADYVH